MSLYVTRLQRTHRLEHFDSGVQELDSWLRLHGRSNDLRYNTAAVWVLCDDGVDSGAAPLGYYCLAAHAVALDDVAPAGLAQSKPWPNPVPAVLLGRLAVQKPWQGRGLGTRLLRDAVMRTVAMRAHVSASLLVVDAIGEDATTFYATRGFTPITGRRLVARVKDLERSFEGPPG